MPIAATRSMLAAALSGELDDVALRTDQLFGFAVPVSVPGADVELLDPRSTWSDPAAYDAAARRLAQLFVDNFSSRFSDAADSIRTAGPRL